MEPRPAAGRRPGGVDADAWSGAVGSGLPDQTHQLRASGHLSAADACALGDVGVGVRHQRSTSVPSTFLRAGDRKSTRLNSSHVAISYAVFCLKKKKTNRDNLLRKHLFL